MGRTHQIGAIMEKIVKVRGKKRTRASNTTGQGNITVKKKQPQ